MECHMWTFKIPWPIDEHRARNVSTHRSVAGSSLGAEHFFNQSSQKRIFCPHQFGNTMIVIIARKETSPCQEGGGRLHAEKLEATLRVRTLQRCFFQSEGKLLETHQDHIADKRISLTVSVRVGPLLTARNFQWPKLWHAKRWKRCLPAGEPSKSSTQCRPTARGSIKNDVRTLRNCDGPLPPETFRVDRTRATVQMMSRSSKRPCQRRRRMPSSLSCTRSTRISDDSRKSSRHHILSTWNGWRSKRCSLRSFTS